MATRETKYQQSECSSEKVTKYTLKIAKSNYLNMLKLRTERAYEVKLLYETPSWGKV